MTVYVCTFMAAILLGVLADYENRIGNERKALVCVVATAMLLSIVAGLRATTVGIDIAAYALPYYDRASYSNDLIAYLASVNTDVLYGALCYISAHLFGGIGMLLFFSQVLVALPVCLAAYARRDQLDIASVIFIYVFGFYNISLCLMRQFIACALVLLAFVRCFDGKSLRAAALVCVAILFHKSAVLILPFGLICVYYREREMPFPLKAAMIIAAAFVVLMSAPVFSLAQEWIPGLINQASIVDQHMQAGSMGIAGTAWRFFLCLMPIAGLAFQSIAGERPKPLSEGDMVIILPLVGLVLSFAGLSSAYFARISYYFYFFWLLSFQYVRSIFTDWFGRVLIGVSMGVGFVVYWYVVYIVLDSWGTSQYVFAFI